MDFLVGDVHLTKEDVSRMLTRMYTLENDVNVKQSLAHPTYQPFEYQVVDHISINHTRYRLLCEYITFD